MIFKKDVSDVYNQVNTKSQLSKFLNINDMLTLKQYRELYSRNRHEKYLELTLKTIK